VSIVVRPSQTVAEPSIEAGNGLMLTDAVVIIVTVHEVAVLVAIT
jgi:hypothetical protein